VAPK
jgi:elongation factor 1-gamma